MIKGQAVLSDGSTLEEHGIIDGSTVNIVIEPEKEIKLIMELGPKVFIHNVVNSVRVRELKQKLIDDRSVGFSINEFQLILSADDNDEVDDDISLDDESLPLHLSGLVHNKIVKISTNKHSDHLVTTERAALVQTIS